MVTRAVVRRAMYGARMHRAVIEHLCRESDGVLDEHTLDIRCCCLVAAPQTAPRHPACVDPGGVFQEFDKRRFDCVFSMDGFEESGEMRQFLESCSLHLNDGGLLALSNINLAAIHDRIFDVLFNWTSRSRMRTSIHKPPSKVIPLRDVMRILSEAGFRVRGVRYMAAGMEDWLWLPFALLTYPVQLLYVSLTRNPMAVWQKRRLYPLRSLLCSHYVVICDRSLDHASH